MPKGMTPKARMDERLDTARRREASLSGKDLYDRSVDRLSEEDDENMSMFNRGARALVNTMANARRGQLERQNAPELSQLRGQISKIEGNRDIAAEQGTKKFRKGGMVGVKGCKSGQFAGKNFRGTF